MDEAEPVRPQLDLAFALAPSGETYLARQYAAFPFHAGRCLQLDERPAGTASVVLQSLGAGLVQGDSLIMAVEAGAGTRAHVTTQGATVAHAMARGRAHQEARLTVRCDARLDWLPRPTILFPDAEVTSLLEIVLEEGARVAWCDGFLGHDPQGGQGRFRRYAAETRLQDGAGRLLALDRFDIDGGVLDEPGTMAGLTCHAGFGLAGARADGALAAAWRRALDGIEGVMAGVSALPGGAGLFCRLLAADGVALQRATAALVAASDRPPPAVPDARLRGQRRTREGVRFGIVRDGQLSARIAPSKPSSVSGNIRSAKIRRTMPIEWV